MMSKCPNCKKAFAQDKLQMHSKTCKSSTIARLDPNPAKSSQNLFAKTSKSPAAMKSSSPGLSPVPKEKVFSRPKAVMCHIW